MLSRVANSIYWMSRYLERADNVARFVRVNLLLMLDMGLERYKAQWEPMVKASGDEADFAERYKEAKEKNVIHFLTFDKKNPNSILTCIQNARENARTVREIIPSDLWEAINELHHLVQKWSRKRGVDDLQEFYTMIRRSGHLFNGLIENSMSRGQGWHFARMGKMLERADKTARILDVKYFLLLPNTEHVGSLYDAVEWGAVLKSVNAFEMYRKQFHRVDYHNVAEFLIFEPLFPRSMLFCVNAAARSLTKIINILQIEVPAQAEMEKLCAMLKNTNVDAVLSHGLHEFIDVFQFNLNIVDKAIYDSFFALQDVVQNQPHHQGSTPLRVVSG